MIRAALMLTFLAAAATAQVAGPCDPALTDAGNVDWSDPTRVFSNGQVRLVALQDGEESFHVMVLFPEAEPRGCTVVSAADGTGFAELSLRRTTARYASLGALELAVPGTGPGGDPVLIEFTADPGAALVALR